MNAVPSRTDQIVAAYANGEPVERITAQFGVSRAEVESIVATAPATPPNDERFASADKATIQAEEIIARYAAGESTTAISTSFNLSPAEVEAIVAANASPTQHTTSQTPPAWVNYSTHSRPSSQSESPPGPSASSSRTRRAVTSWPLVAIGVVVLALALIGIVAIVSPLLQGADGPTDGAGPAERGASARLATAQETCDPSKTGTTLTDGGTSLLVDGAGTEDYTGVDYDDLLCVLSSLDTPDAVVSHMTSTRALDGRQEDSWDGLTASWSYHPDDGLDIIIRAA